MAIGVDTSTWKPRKIKGTPAARTRNLIACGIIGFGLLCGGFYQFSGITAKFRKAFDVFYEDPIEEVERRLLIASGLPLRTGDHIREIIEDFERPDRPHNEASNSCDVVSKYFTHSVMEERCKKTNQKQRTSKPSQSDKPQKKPRKRVRGQKDIRTLIKPKKNELVTYSKDFKLVCKQSGIDVDPEQLQLAIALSKSLQDSQAENKEPKTVKNLTANQRKGKIRTTLQEYGFKVPEVSTSKKVKRYRKHYKLILASDSEKQQIIADRYAQVLFRNVSKVSNDSIIEFDNSNCLLYNLTTNVSYDFIKDDNVFYIDGLVEKTLNNDHSMLRDWSKIPGRPVSPKTETPKIDFKSIEFSQEELKNILSGAVEKAQEIVNRNYKSKKAKSKSPEKIDLSIHNPDSESQTQNEIEGQLKENLDEMGSNDKANTSFTIDLATYKNTHSMTPPSNRSHSPDIFDDDVTMIMDNSKDRVTVQEDKSEKTIIREPNDYMDLTECVEIVNFNNTNLKQTLCLSQGSNKTRQNPNDFMELTACVTASSQQKFHDTKSTDNYGNENDAINDEISSQAKAFDLTQSSKPNSSLPVINKDDCKDNSLEDTIIMINDDYCNINTDGISATISKEADVIVLEDDLDIPKFLTAPIHCSVNNSQENRENSNDEINFVNNDEPNFQHNEYEEDIPFSRNCDQNKDLDTRFDLTQSSKSDDDLPSVHRSNLKSPLVDIVSNHESEEDNRIRDLSEDRQNSPDDINYEYTISQSITNTETANGISDYKYDHSFDSPTKDIRRSPYSNSESNKTNNDNVPKNIRSPETMDLTQSSNSEENLHHCDHNRLTDDTILLNDEDYFSSNLAKNDVKECGDINVEVQDISLKNCRYANKEGRQHTAFDPDNDREFDNLVENVSKSKKSTTTASNSYDSDDDEVESIVDLSKSANQSFRGCEIDLTQPYGAEDDIHIPYDELGKRNNVSIDYDDYIEVDNRHESSFDEKFVGKESHSKDEVLSRCSQNSEVFEISDNEFNYSIHQHKQDNSIRLDRTKFDIGGPSIIEDFLNRNSLSNKRDKLRCSCSSNYESNSNENRNQSCLLELTNHDNLLISNEDKISNTCPDVESVKIVTPTKSKSSDNVLFAQTPRHNDYVVKTDQVTPMPKYEMMSSPERNQELDKYGIKPLKRKRAIQILTHIYNQTHPLMEVISDSEACSSPKKIRRKNDLKSFPKRAISTQIESLVTNNYTNLPGPSEEIDQVPILSQKSSKSSSRNLTNESPEYLGDEEKENNLYEETKQLPDIKDIECSSEEWVFQKREKSKVHSCRLPLHIAFHNYVSCRRALREAILRYEPINIDDIHKGLVATGYRYNPKDLLKFLDKKCITVKTADNAKNNRK